MVICSTCKDEIKDITEGYFEVLIHAPLPRRGDNKVHMVHNPFREKPIEYGWFNVTKESGNAGYIDCRTSTTRYEDWRAVNKGMPALDIRDLKNVKESTVPEVLTTDNGGWADGEANDKIIWVGDPATKIVSFNGIGFIAPMRINGYSVEDKHFFDCQNFVNWATFLEQMKEFNIPISSVV